MPIFNQTKWSDVHVWKRAQLEPFPLHFHSYVELLYIEKGSAACKVDFKEYPLEKGDALFVFPDQLHEITYASEGCENYLLFFPKELFLLDGVFERNVPQSSVIKGVTEEMGELFFRAREAFRNIGREYSKMESLGYIYILLAKLLPFLTLSEKKHGDMKFERAVIEYCTKHFSEPIHLTDVATVMGYTPSYFSDIFSDKFKGGFSSFLNTIRIEEAKKLLLEESAISEIAFACGFGSIRSFNRVFKEQIGKTPREYREAKKKK